MKDTIKNRLRDLRQEKKLTQDELAFELNKDLKKGEKLVSKMTISNWENNKHAIKPDKAQKLAEYFGVSVGYLLGYSDYWEYIDHEITSFLTKETMVKFLDFLIMADLMLNDEQISNILELLKSIDVANRSATLYETQVYGSEKALSNFLLRYNYKPDSLLMQHIDAIYSQEKIENQFTLIEKLNNRDN
ncbi:helix-turn-helix transcriptional regulator [Streptococcus plurextorum]|uniref:helix-turn-helix transcriptional regulator n=1 Tax=Streptococcus plurextorum TaxID=456876 RepID=UPI00040B0078|nr:helix-turn-helix transcriptional regulator [Streptococcus plurextorum]